MEQGTGGEPRAAEATHVQEQQKSRRKGRKRQASEKAQPTPLSFFLLIPDQYWVLNLLMLVNRLSPSLLRLAHFQRALVLCSHPLARSRPLALPLTPSTTHAASFMSSAPAAAAAAAASDTTAKASEDKNGTFRSSLPPVLASTH